MAELEQDMDATFPTEEHQRSPMTEWELFKKQLSDIPHSFEMRKQELITMDTFRGLKNHLEAAVTHGYKTSLETAQSTNLLAYVDFRLGMRREALERLESVLQLEGQKHNLVTLANMATILWWEPELRQEAEKHLQFLQQLREDEGNFHYLKVKAKAELASSYMRFGRDFHNYAISIFEEVIPEAKETEVWIWKFALAVHLRHTLDLQHGCPDGHDEQKHFEVLSMLQEIIDSSGCRSLQANANVEVALLIRSAWNPDVEQALCRRAKTGVMKACKEALRLDSDEPSVLWKAGKLFRYYRDVVNSRKYLEKAVSLQPSSSAYHHLALTYKAFATEAKYGKPRARRGRRLNGRNRKGRQGRGGARAKEERMDEGLCDAGDHGTARVARAAGGGRQNGASAPNEREDGTAEAALNSEKTARGHSGRGRGGKGRGRVRAGPHPARPQHARNTFGNEEASLEVQTTPIKEDFGLACSLPLDAGAPYPLAMEDVDMQDDLLPADSGFGSIENPNPELASLESNLRSAQIDEDTMEGGLIGQEIQDEDREDAASNQGSESEDEIADVQSPPAPNVRLMRAVKSAPKNTTKFVRNDAYVAETMKYLQLAVEFSHGENTRATYDLALMHRALDEFTEALKLFQDIRSRRSSRGPLDEICALDQEGLILQEMAETEKDEGKRGQLQEEAKSMFDAALSAASEQYSPHPETTAFIGYIWHSFPALQNLMQNSDKSDDEKMEEKARLLGLVRRHNQLIVLKKELEELADEENSKKHLKERVQLCIREKEYAKALNYAYLLQYKAMGNPKGVLFQEEQFMQKLRLLAGKEALLHRSARKISGQYFREAFVEAFKSPAKAASCSEPTFDTDSNNDEVVWDVMLLHEEELEADAAVLKKLLLEACGLMVRSMEDAPPTKPEVGLVCDDMARSRLVVVMLAKGRKLSKDWRIYLGQEAVKRQTTVILKLSDDCHVPRTLKTHRSMPCPAELLNTSVNMGGPYDGAKVEGIWQLFCFLIGIDANFEITGH